MTHQYERPAKRPAWTTLALLLLVTALVSACSQSEPATTPPDEACGYGASGSHVPRTLTDIARHTDVAVHGQVVEALPSQWNTSDGQSPAVDCVIDVTREYIFTPFVIDLHAPAFINTTDKAVSGGQIVVAVHGGVVGNDVMQADTSQAFQIGAEAVLNLSTSPPLSGDGDRRPQTPRGQAWHVLYTFDARPDGLVDMRLAPATGTAPGESAMPVADLINALTTAAAEQSPATTTPSP